MNDLFKRKKKKAKVAPPPAPAVPSSSGEDLMARIARLAQTEVEPPLTFEPLK